MTPACAADAEGEPALLGLLGKGGAAGFAGFAEGDVLCGDGDVALEGNEVAAGLLVVLAGGEGEGDGGGARRGKRQGEQEEESVKGHELVFFGIFSGCP